MKAIKLYKGQYLSDVEPFKSNGIPNNSIIHKTVTGCGITTFAISEFKHHCIIILPNVPVITDKVAEQNKKFPSDSAIAVYEETNVDDIEVYLLKDIKYKKILTTPEGFISKVMKAFDGNLETLYSQYFLLFDECEKVVTDVSYRGAIAAPFDVFFNFHNRAMVSATTLPFSGPLLQDLNHYVIEPQYDHSKPLSLITTNNVLASIQAFMERVSGEQVCIFFNSTEGIKPVIDHLGIKDESVVFCAQKSVHKLLLLKFHNGTNAFKVKVMKAANFFTSRYFSAFDIKLDDKPHVLIVSDLFTAEHSIIDPQTEAIQIAGRFRNGVNSLTHIANFKSSLDALEPDAAINYLEGSLDLHDRIVAMLKKNNQKSSVDMLKFINKKSPMANFYTNGIRNPFMIDNALNEHRVKRLYQKPEKLINAYEQCDKHFVLKHIEEVYPVGDENLYNLRSLQSKKAQLKEAAKLLSWTMSDASKPGSFKLKLQYLEDLRKTLIDMFPFLPEAVTLLGLEGLEKTGFVKSAITKAVNNANRRNADRMFAPCVQEAFKNTVLPVESEMITKLEALAAQHGYEYAISGSTMKRFFTNAKRTQGGRQNVWKWDAPIDFTSIQD